jgi:hypothetical protein
MARNLRIKDKLMVDKYSSQQIKDVVTALNAHQEKSYISHQWEEVVLYLIHDNDPQLREKMYREMDAILNSDPGFKIFSLF